MGTILETEMRTGAMIRTMSGAVRDALRQELYSMYEDENGNITGYRETCAKWHWLLLVYCKDMDLAKKFILLIQIAFENGEDLDKDEWWKFMMRITLPEQAVRQIKEGEFTQVPKLSIIDQTEFVKKKPKKEKAVFRMY